ncbi:hypothetical protein ACWDKQ_34095 [Saccharopolyspora sp. NPDC000995]
MTGQLTAARERVHDVDALRGFALLGILIVNITFMATGYPGNLVADPALSTTYDDIVRGLSSVLVDMEFYLLFSFLFGYSFTLQTEAAHRAGTAFAPRMLRRITGLFALGVLHIVSLLVIQAVSMQPDRARDVPARHGRRPPSAARPDGDEAVLRPIQWIGFPVGLAGGLIYTFGGGNGHPLAVAASVATALLAAAYVATLLRVMQVAWPRGRPGVGAAVASVTWDNRCHRSRQEVSTTCPVPQAAMAPTARGRGLFSSSITAPSTHS